ncbi:cyclic lactone autoinducer peptide [Lachnotalea glycerini]|jgi:cyclic lactone autoinducer peptide|uniref:Cyclic lactone autoinducer peptide n=1 Tax=Lachnotalea glycerini TaxID=1763509 RepID=A0A255IJH5_9FIRM|nr:cyclic lactone autoinducer peptide [Lachnotalea glycerini]PXV95602.1 cyclic lactone autoinducer peptide [Lachnotalea glycerini]RDY32892.1 cyclic lactone autoinducer peptide [Lachnotalea glycerini]
MDNKITICQKIIKPINFLALLLVKQTANASCAWVFHQPEFPEEASKFKKYHDGLI